MKGLFVIALLAACVVSLPAQKKKEDAGIRTVQGTVLDPDEKAVTGAVVQLKDMRSLQVRSFISQDGGSYHFTGLKLDNDYQLKADYNGLTSGWKTLSIFDTRKEPVMNLKLEKK
jgi:hypothetical protein